MSSYHLERNEYFIDFQMRYNAIIHFSQKTGTETMGAESDDQLTRILSLDSFSSEQLREDTVKDSGLDHLQMSNGFFQGQLLRCQMDDVILDTGVYSQDMLVMGTMPDDGVTLGYILGADRPGYFNGTRLNRHDLVVCSEGAAMDSYHLPAGTQWVALQLPRQQLESQGISAPVSPGVEIFSGFNPAKLQLGRKLETVFHEIYLEARVTEPGHHIDPEAMAETLTIDFRQALDAVTGLEQKKFKLSAGQRLRVLYRVDEFIRNNLDRAIRIGELCALTGVSQRSLEYLFRDHYGVSPVRYLATRRVHAVREQLLKMRPEETTVASLAAAYGFRHPGRFAQAYRLQFGEFPSATLACVASRSKTGGQPR